MVLFRFMSKEPYQKELARDEDNVQMETGTW